MISIEHAALWTTNLEKLKAYYVNHFSGTANEKYTNPAKQSESYFISFSSGARLELIQMPNIPANVNDTVKKQHLGLIHLAFGVETRAEVDAKAEELKEAGYEILSGPRVTGDGYNEFETLDPDGNRLEVTCKQQSVDRFVSRPGLCPQIAQIKYPQICADEYRMTLRNPDLRRSAAFLSAKICRKSNAHYQPNQNYP